MKVPFSAWAPESNMWCIQNYSKVDQETIARTDDTILHILYDIVQKFKYVV